MDNKIILTGGDHYNGLALVRLFGKNGFRPFGIIIGPEAKSGFLKESKYWNTVWTVENDAQIIGILLKEFANETEKPVIIPWSDGAAAEIDKNLDRLQNRFLVPSINGCQGQIYSMMDKSEQIRLAEDCGLQTADSYIIRLDESYSIDDISIPCIGKPIVSCEGEKKDIRRCDTKEELLQYLQELREMGYQKILLQEYVQMDAEYDIEGYIHQDDYAYFVSRKIRTWPNTGGPTSYAISVSEADLNIFAEEIMNMLKERHYTGLFDIEVFRIGSRFLLNEINWRNSALCFAATEAHFYYPLYWYCAVSGKPYSILTPEKYGYYAMNELLDFKHVNSKDVSVFTWLKEWKNSKAKAYYDKDDKAPLKRRLAIFINKRIHRGKAV